MTPEQEQAIRIDHQRTVTSTGVEVCTGGGVWPCDAALLLAALDEARAEWARERERRRKNIASIGELADERDAARADADRLAEALRSMGQAAVAMAWDKPGAGDRAADAYEQARAALRLHDEP